MNDRIPTHQRDHYSMTRAAALALASLFTAALLAGGCGDDDPGSGGTASIEEGLQELQGFADGATNSTEGQVLGTDQVGALLEELGLTLGGSTLFATRLEQIQKGEASLPRRSAIAPRVLLGTIFGTYDRDTTDTTVPFPGWVLAEPNNPPDGFIFRFDEKDDIVIEDSEGNPVHLAGEIRFLEIEADLGGTPDPADDVLLHVHFEVSIVGESPNPLVRLEYHATLDENREPETFEIGDESDLNASYLGDISIAASFNGVGDDLAALVQLVNQVPNPDYVVRLGFTATDIDTSEVPQSATFTFGYGRSNTATDPPWVIFAALDSFVVDPKIEDVNANVEGTITHRGSLVATFTGNTREVPVSVDTDGDGDVDANDTCIDVDITLAGETESQNICEALGPFFDMIPFIGDQGGDTSRFLPNLN